ncbi:Beta-galactosidase C-terminal domain [Streptomyces sp. TRM68367]|uniref:Beta-galactosidase C-terminal domain n=1 Tax=Streptomyces sp. TRM68367 TaxID=2758415 RepID=UPI00165AE08D|nr:Beta-galactosidase C-terminal domain [Streptomyces sp. TRM68367]MBC9726241.1 Beta-galactosidase C-terminal domain [Streptomyces sp. TRM68367]
MRSRVPPEARALLTWAAPADTWRPAHPGVTATSAVNRDGHRVRFLHNWSWGPVTVPVPEPLRDALSGEAYEEAVPLGPRDVKVLRSQRACGGSPAGHQEVVDQQGEPGLTGQPGPRAGQEGAGRQQPHHER